MKVGEGQLSVAYESNSTVYTKDALLEKLGLDRPADRKWGDSGSNNFLKTDYTLGRFSAGIQFDGYLPALYGYDIYKYGFNNSKYNMFITKYVQWEDSNWGVRVGDIYDQFGNGLIFRTYEDRNLAFNNALAGARAYYNFNNMVNVKVIAGLPRLYDIRSKNPVWGTDLSLSISDMTGWNNGVLAIEGSYVGRLDSDISEFADKEWFTTDGKSVALDKKLLNMVSGRVNFEYSGFSLRGEYVAKLDDNLYNAVAIPGKGNAIYVDMGYNYKRFSATATFRRLKGMTTPIDQVGLDIAGGNVLSYIPTLTRQHTYSLAGFYPFMGTPSGNEIGGQIDLYYSLRNPKARGKYWNFHTNFSMFNTYEHQALGGGTNTVEGRNVWLDFNFDVERQWNKTVKSTFFYSYQRRDSDQYDTPEAHYSNSHIVVGDVTYKFNKKHSMRFEAQYLFNSDFCGDWVAATVEYNFAPKFSFYVSDMWNCSKQGDVNNNTEYDNFWITDNLKWTGENFLLHYYQIGTSYTHNSLRAQLSYGRNREGIVCSGGVCRKQPAYTGVNLAITISF